MIPSGGAYGDRKDMQEIQSGAAMQGGGGTTPTPAALIPFGAPTQSPGEPVTAGAELGAGIGPQAAGIQTDAQISAEQIRPMLRSLEAIANLPFSTPETRSFVRMLRSRLNG